MICLRHNAEALACRKRSPLVLLFCLPHYSWQSIAIADSIPLPGPTPCKHSSPPIPGATRCHQFWNPDSGHQFGISNSRVREKMYVEAVLFLSVICDMRTIQVVDVFESNNETINTKSCYHTELFWSSVKNCLLIQSCQFARSVMLIRSS